MRGDQAELAGGDETGELTEHAIHERAPAARASAYVENPAHEIILMGLHSPACRTHHTAQRTVAAL